MTDDLRYPSIFVAKVSTDWKLLKEQSGPEILFLGYRTTMPDGAYYPENYGGERECAVQSASRGTEDEAGERTI